MGELKLINLADVQIEEIEWLWKPYIPKGKVTLVRGMPGEGKTMVLSSLVAALTNGDPLFNEEERHEPVSCIYQSAEDGLGDTIKPRLERGDAVQRKVWAINEEQDPLSFTDARIEEAIRDTGAGLMILDPLQAYLGANVDMYRPNEVRPVMTNLVNIAHRTHCAIVLVEHMNKVKGASAITRGLGSMDITGAARSVLMIGKANDHSEEVYLAHVKSNLAPKGPTLVFTIEDKRAFCEGTTELSADQLLGCEDVPAYQQTKSGTVEDALLSVFSDVDEVLSQQVYDFFGGNGISRRTVNSVKKKLGIHSVKRGDAWYWLRPDSIPPQRKNEGCNLISI